MVKKIVVVGGGFAGLTLARKLNNCKDISLLLIDKNNYHQFQPLLYQVATAGLEAGSIIFPFRKILRGSKNVRFMMAEVKSVDMQNKKLQTDTGEVEYDYLVLSMGANNNFFNNKNIETHALPMKSLSESLNLRNTFFEILEQNANNPLDKNQENRVPDVVIVGGGPTGVELAGSIAEMRKHILPKDYPELDFSEMDIHLIQGGTRILDGMHPSLSEKAENYLKKMQVKVWLGNYVSDITDTEVILKSGVKIPSKITLWAAGIKGNTLPGLPETCITKGNRIQVDNYNKIIGTENIFCLGDQALMNNTENGNGHPQMAQPAIQQAKNLAKNFIAIQNNKPLKEFVYKNQGSMATVGRNKAVVQLPGLKFGGFIAWIMWLFVHLMSIVGVRNRFFIFFHWLWNYLTYDLSLRFIIKKR